MTVYQGEPLNILHTIGMQELYPIVRIGFTVQGGFDQDRFEQALLQCGRIVPELFCKYDLQENSFVPVTNDLTGVLFCGLDPDTASADWDLLTDPQLRVYLNRGQEGSEVTIFLSHILTDGAGAKQLLSLLAAAYNGDSLAGIKNHQDIDWLCQLLREHPVEIKQGTDHPAKPLSMPRLADQADQRRRTRTLRLDRATTLALINASHNRKVTLNDLFMAAFGQAVQRYSATDQIALTCPTDMRQFIPGTRQLRVANHTSRYNIAVPADPEGPFEKTVRAIHEAMTANKRTFQCLTSVKTLVDNYDRYSLEKLQQICEENYHVRSISYTNFGVVNFQLNGSLITDFSMLGSYRQAPMFQVAVSTYADQLNFSYAMVGNDEEARVGNTVLAMMRDLLTNYALKFA